MTLANETNAASYTTDGSGQTYYFPYEYFTASDLVVYYTVAATGVETTLDSTTDYTVTPTNGDTYQGATITTTLTYAAGNTIEIKRVVSLTQEFDPQDGTAISSTQLERAFDRTVAQSQQLYDMITDLLVVTNALASLSIEAPDGGHLATYDPDTATVANTMDFLATLARAIKGEDITT
jgi:hypothetical protein